MSNQQMYLSGKNAGKTEEKAGQMKEKALGVASDVSEASQQKGQEAAGMASGAIDSIKSTSSDAIGAIKSTASGTTETVKSTASGAAETVKSTASGAVETVKSTTSSAVETVKNTLGLGEGGGSN